MNGSIFAYTRVNIVRVNMSTRVSPAEEISPGEASVSREIKNDFRKYDISHYLHDRWRSGANGG